ncbi:UvrD-helicase domain-containing protein [Dyadobacter sediminis]|uniref:DNA 3'-5' helicase n=1 Tax=Dyadobacter sediminis TaxID=1493691 RepID=A0A5R9KJ95_9BACT|nr:UvrD-helicase domain-containing protein [Dyadobacter sediminis]TLU96293.1 DNA helicase UvrD [Dyadobacter sediminis]GGB80998.1 ATP-dependent helicase [Dyadobacter sediminis]
MFKVYSSSAGSGKTYTLTKEYLKLALHSNSETYFRHILAVTFTNAAANEMKDRILLMLRTFAGSFDTDVPPHPMLKEVVTEMYPDAIHDPALFSGACQLIAGRAHQVFRQILHRYSDFSVMTIDKFTQRLISSFTDELGIPFIFETQLDGELLDQAVDRLLARIGQEGEEILTGIVEKYYRESADEGKSWGALPMQIRETSGTLLSEQSYMHMKRVADLKMEDWVAIRNQMRAFVREREAAVVSHSKEAFGLIQSAFLTEKDFHQGGRGIYGYFRERSEEKKIWAEPNSYVYKTIGEGTWYGAKTAVLIKDSIEQIRTELENHFHRIENIRLTESEKIMLFSQLDRHIYNLSLLGEIRKEFDALLKQNNQVHISDFNRKIVEIVSREPVPFIFERLGERYNHILVDEFQDTSKLQFANLLPLMENALGSGYFNLIVGDAKQSIYRFRGGDMDLILHMAQSQVMQIAELLGSDSYNSVRLWSLDNYLEISHLKVNYRSSREITDFNNKFFEFIANTTGNEFPLVKDVYDHNFQQEIPEHAKGGGHVEVEFLNMHEESDEISEGEIAKDAMILRALELVSGLRQQGYFWRDIAILCRKKNEAAALANAMKEAGFPLISDDALLLSYSRSVHFIISFMKVLHTSDNRLARYEAAYLFHHVVRRENPAASEYEQIRILCEERGLDSFLGYFKRWNIVLPSFRMRQLSVFELSEQLMQRFGLFKNQYENEYLFRFLDVVLEYGNRKSNHLGDFLIHWETARHKLSITIPAETDAMRITTIHKSKGLEYPVVIVPYAHWKVTPNARLDKIWLDLNGIRYDELVLKDQPSYSDKRLRSSLVSVVKDLESTSVSAQYQDERTRTLVENLNLLYVAFTRPVQRLYVLAKSEKKWDAGQQVSNWLHEYVHTQDFKSEWSVNETKYIVSQGDSNPRHAHVKTDSKPFIVKDILSSDRTESLRLRRMADRIFDVHTFEQKHDRLQKIRHLVTRLKSVSELPQALEKLVSEGMFTKSESGQITEQAYALLSDPLLQGLYSDENKIQTDTQLLVPGGKLLHIDRVVQRPDGEFVFMTFIGGSSSEEPKRHLKKLIKTYENAGKKSRGVLITLEDESIEWIEG